VALFNITVKLSGNDGNAFAIMGSVRNALKKAGATKEQLDQYTMDSMSGDYQNLLRVASRYVNIK
jgi:formyltetrahydrofolate synthetase